MSDTTVRRPIKWVSFADTHVGMVRSINEDSVLDKSDVGLWAVADGMGGYEAGDVASSMIVKTLNETENIQPLNDIVDTVEDSLMDVNHRILEYADIMLDSRTTGSTVVCLIIRGAVGVCLWAGDSRLYRFRNQQLEQLSQDHSQVEELVRQGLLSAEEAKNHPDSNIITRAIGAHSEVCVDINSFSTQIGDTFLLCSDGLYNSVSDEDLIHFLKQNDAQKSVDGLIAKALENGASDNVSVIVLKGEPDVIEVKPVLSMNEPLAE